MHFLKFLVDGSGDVYTLFIHWVGYVEIEVKYAESSNIPMCSNKQKISIDCGKCDKIRFLRFPQFDTVRLAENFRNLKKIPRTDSTRPCLFSCLDCGTVMCQNHKINTMQVNISLRQGKHTFRAYRQTESVLLYKSIGLAL